MARADAQRKKWTVSGPFEPSRDVFHIAPDPRHPGTVYLATNSGWWGPALYRSRDYGRKWTEVSVPGTPRVGDREPPFEMPSAKYPIKNLWHVEPGPASEPKTVYLGVDPASLWRSDDEGGSWTGVVGLNDHPSRAQWNPGAGGMCLHTILLDPVRPKRMYVGISAAGFFRTDDGGRKWEFANKGVEAPFLPDRYPEFGQCVHKIALDSSDPTTLYRQDHGGIYISRDSAAHWTRVGKGLPDDFGFVVATAPGHPGEAYFVPLDGEARTVHGGHLQVYRWGLEKQKWQPLVKKGAFPGAFGIQREGLAVDGLDPTGVYVGTTTGQLFLSPDAGRSWSLVPYQFPGIHSVSVGVD
ncbi:MAG: exo-alpha-sialidase [Thermoplasmata archaeon]